MKKSSRHLHGFSLVEVALALGVASFCLITLLGLISGALTSNKDSLARTTASGLAAAVVSDLRARVSNVSPQYSLTVAPSSTMTATPSATLYLDEAGQKMGSAAAARFRVSLYYSTPAAGIITPPGLVHVLVTWPALIDPSASNAYTDSFEVTTTVNP